MLKWVHRAKGLEPLDVGVSASPVIAQESFTPITAGVRPNLTVRFSVAGSAIYALIELDNDYISQNAKVQKNDAITSARSRGIGEVLT